MISEKVSVAILIISFPNDYQACRMSSFSWVSTLLLPAAGRSWARPKAAFPLAQNAGVFTTVPNDASIFKITAIVILSYVAMCYVFAT